MAELKIRKAMEVKKNFKLTHSIDDKTKNYIAGVQVWKNGPGRIRTGDLRRVKATS